MQYITIISVDIDNHSCVFNYFFQEDYKNLLLRLHGSVIAILADILSEVVVSAFDQSKRVHKIINSSVTFYDSIKANEKLKVVVEANRMGNSYSFLHISFINTSNKVLCYDCDVIREFQK